MTRPLPFAELKRREAGRAARRFARVAREAFEASADLGPAKSIAAGWSDGVLVLAATGQVAEELDLLLRREGICAPNGGPPARMGRAGA